MKYKTEIFTAVLTALLIFSIVKLTLDAKKISKPENTEENLPEQTVYTVKEYSGKIAVFCGDEEYPEKILNSPYVRDLPKADRERLVNGITFFSISDVDALLEDYES